MLLHITELSSKPLHTQISRQLMDKIIDGDLAGGEELLSIRKLARKQRVSVHTVQKAFEELQREGLIRSKDEGFVVAHLTEDQREQISSQKNRSVSIPLNIVESFSKQLISVFDPEKLCKIVEENISDHLHTKEVHFAILDDQSGEYILIPSDSNPDKYTIFPDDPVLEAIRGSTSHLNFNSLIIESTPGNLQGELILRDTQIIFPLNEADQFLGFLALTGKKDSSPYTREELNLLTVLVNQFITAMTTARLYVEVLEKRRLEEELIIARQIQSDLLPKDLPRDGQMAIEAYIQPSYTVGGDFYDVVQIDENRYGLVIADASGKGLPAAMLISHIQAMLRSEIRNGNTIQHILHNVNNQVLTSTPKDKFITLFFGIYNKQTRFIQYVNAGHNCPIVVCSDGRMKLLKTGGPGLGMIQNAAYKTGRLRLQHEDTVCFYTDGFTETMNENHEEYGEHRLEEALLTLRKRDAGDIIETVLDDLSRFQRSNTGQDDRTMFVLKVMDEKSDTDHLSERKPEHARMA